MKIDDEIEDYCLKHSTEEDALLQQITRKTYLRMVYPRMLSGHLQGRLLSYFSKLSQPKRILEIGTFTAYATLCLAEGLAENGIIHTIEINPELETFIRENINESRFSKSIQLHIGDALTIIPELEEVFDMVFIDADKAQYSEYFKLIIDKVRKGGLIIADNVLWGGKVLRETSKKDVETSSVKEFNEMIRLDSRIEKLMLPLRDGLTVMIKKT
ncbi:MAG: O-methyltransferase [Bacteroidota bacterium]